MILRWLTFFGILFGLMGAGVYAAAKQPTQTTRDDEFRRRQIETERARHTEYTE